MWVSIDALPGIVRQLVEMFAKVLAQTRHLLRQDDAKFGNQATQAVIGGGTLWDEALAGAVSAEDDVLGLMSSDWPFSFTPGTAKMSWQDQFQ